VLGEYTSARECVKSSNMSTARTGAAGQAGLSRYVELCHPGAPIPFACPRLDMPTQCLQHVAHVNHGIEQPNSFLLTRRAALRSFIFCHTCTAALYRSERMTPFFRYSILKHRDYTSCLLDNHPLLSHVRANMQTTLHTVCF
jgi:hypothetical protein